MNLNCSYAKSSNIKSNLCQKLDNLLKLCGELRMDISYVYLTIDETDNGFRDFEECLYYQCRLKDMGINLVTYIDEGTKG